MDIHKLTVGKASVLTLAAATLVSGVLFFRTIGLVSADHYDQDNGHRDHATATPTPTPTPTPHHDDHDNKDCKDQDNHDDHDRHDDKDCNNNHKSPSPSPTATPTETPTATPSATLVPTATATPGFTNDGGDGLGCAVHDCSGNYVAPPQGQVLGASTMAGTGSFEEVFYQAIMGIGATLSAFGIKGLKKVRKTVKK